MKTASAGSIGRATSYFEELCTRAVRELEELLERVGGVDNVTEENMPEAHIRGDINTPYRCIGGTIFAMPRAGFMRIGFISGPPAGGPAVERDTGAIQ